MGDDMMDKYREVQPDPPDGRVPYLLGDAQDVLVRQSGFNRTLLEASEMCGCYHCGRRFPTSLIVEWMPEPGEEDTGVCPYCGVDALVVGYREFPLCTALLTLLFCCWFPKELKHRMECSTYVPGYRDRNDFARQGIPFLCVEIGDVITLAEMDLWSVGRREPALLLDPYAPPGRFTGAALGGTWNVQVVEETAPDGLRYAVPFAQKGEDDWYHPDTVTYFELVRGPTTVPFLPFTGDDQRKLLDLWDEHDVFLKASFTDFEFKRLRLFVDDPVSLLW